MLRRLIKPPVRACVVTALRQLPTAVLAIVLLLAARDARADLILAFTGTTPMGALTVFHYDVLLGSATGTEGMNIGDPVEFVTLYDIPGLMGSALVGAGTDISVQAVGITPAGATVTDSPTLPNITVSLHPLINLAVTNNFFAVATLLVGSSFADLNPNGQFAGQALEGGFTGPLGTNQGITTIPTAPTAVPEPASMTLLGLGLAGLGARQWRQRRR